MRNSQFLSFSSAEDTDKKIFPRRNKCMSKISPANAKTGDLEHRQVEVDTSVEKGLCQQKQLDFCWKVLSNREA